MSEKKKTRKKQSNTNTTKKKTAKRPTKQDDYSDFDEGLKATTKKSVDQKDSGFGSTKHFLDFKGMDLKYFKAAEDYNSLNFYPFKVQTDNHPLFEKGKPFYFMSFEVHRFVGPGDQHVLCPAATFNKTCPICEEVEAMRQRGESKDDVNKLRAKTRTLYWVVDVKEPEKGLQLFEESSYLFQRNMLSKLEALETKKGLPLIVFSSINDGRVVEFLASKTTKGSFTFLEYSDFDFQKRTEPNEEIDKTLLPQAKSFDQFIKKQSYDDIYAILHGNGQEEDEDEEYEEEIDDEVVDTEVEEDEVIDDDVVDDVVDDEDDDEDDEDVEEEEPVKKPKAKKKEAKKKKEISCPAGGTIGDDCENLDACDTCSIFNRCVDIFNGNA